MFNRAIIADNGKLGKNYGYLEEFLGIVDNR